MSEADRKDALRRLREAESLNTFVYVACWSLPWLFADGKEEMEAVRDGCVKGFGHGEKDRESGPDPGRETVKESDGAVSPALWRAQRLAILALHRRAFGHSLRDALVEETFNDTAFKDFHKLQRLLRVQRRELPEKPSGRDEKTDKSRITPEAFLAGMDALAETHIGDLYRSDHAHPVALEHFCDAQDRLDQLSAELLRAERKGDAGEAPEAVGPKLVTHSEGSQNVAELLRDSRWRIHLMLSKGKGFYEAGKLKRSVKWLLKSWSALLVLADFYESKAGKKRRPEWKEVDVEVFDRLEKAIEMLKLIRNDPDFRKSDLRDKIEPVIADIEKAEIPEGLQVIASEILLRLGHVLFILRLDAPPEDDEHPRRRASDIGTEKDDELAHACLKRAKELDKRSTLVAADQLKIEYKRNETPDRDALSDPELQWPYGRGNPDQIIRMIEYHLLWWLAMTGLAAKATSPETAAGSAKAADPVQSARPRDSHDANREANRNVARELIAGLLTHTDSINVRQSQVYRYLMQPKRPTRRIGPVEGWDEDPPRDPFGDGEKAAIEFICLRRYSSFFPFVPRPSAFRSLGGGYLLRLHHEDDGCPRPFGIAVDPGPDFIDNLYRCGFGLGDINMIILTHDHPDHSVDLDPILALLGYRMKQGDPTYQAPGKNVETVRRLLIVGNESVAQQLRFFNKPHVSAPGASEPVRRDAVQVVSFAEFDTFREETNRVRGTERVPEVIIPDELRLKPVVSIRHLDTFGMLAYGFRLSLGDEGPSIGFTGDTGGFLLEQEETVTARGEKPSRQWRIKPHDQHETMKLTGDSTWREHWEDVLSADVLVPHVSGLPLSQLLVLANGGDPDFRNAGEELRDEKLAELLKSAWNGLEESVRKQVSFAFWLPDRAGVSSLPLEEIEKKYKWQKGHLYLIGLLEFARAYREARRYVAKPGLFLIGELREELGSLRGKIATSLNRNIFEADVLESEPGCCALTADIGLRLMISREKGEARVRVLCSTCDLDNDRTREERFHDPKEIREVCVKGENEGMFYNCSNHDPSHHRDPVFLERVERYDVFSPVPIH